MWRWDHSETGRPDLGDATGAGRGGAGSRALHYRVFFVLPDRVEGRCVVGRDTPISPDDVDAIERALMHRLGSSNALVIGWQQLSRGGAAATAGEVF